MRRTFARGRILPQSLSTDPRYGRLSLKARVLYPLLWTSCDDQGRFTGDPDEIKYAVCPNMDDVARGDIPGLLEELQKHGFIRVYTTSGRQALQMLQWWEVQKLQWAWPSEFAAPEGWRDRLRYKKGRREVITKNWVSGETSPEAEVMVSAETPGETSAESSAESPGNGSAGNSGQCSPDVSGDISLDTRVSAESSPEFSHLLPQTVRHSNQESRIKIQESRIKNQNSRIKIQELISPENSGERIPPKGGLSSRGLFEDLLQEIAMAPSQREAIATVGELYRVCAGRAPPYERIGAIASRVNHDFGYLAKLIWEASGKRPAGDLLDYVEGILRRSKSEQDTQHKPSARLRKDFGKESW